MVAGAAGVVPAVSTLASGRGHDSVIIRWRLGRRAGGRCAGGIGWRAVRGAIGGRGCRGAGIQRHVLAVGVAAVQLSGRLIGHGRNLFLLRLMVLPPPWAPLRPITTNSTSRCEAHQPAVALLRRLPKEKLCIGATFAARMGACLAIIGSSSSSGICTRRA